MRTNPEFDPVYYAEQEVLETFKQNVSVIKKRKSLLKFGRSGGVGSSTSLVWNQGGLETLPTTNSIDTVSSSSTSDTEVIIIEGHTVVGTGADAKYTFVVQQATLNGQNKVTLAIPLARSSRAANLGATSLVGDVYVYEDDTIVGGVPQTDENIHLKIEAGDNQTYKCATTFSNLDYAFITNVTAVINRQQSAVVDFRFEIKQPGQVFVPRKRFSAASNGSSTVQLDFSPFLVVPKNTDVRIVATSSTNNTTVAADFQAYLAKVI